MMRRRPMMRRRRRRRVLGTAVIASSMAHNRYNRDDQRYQQQVQQQQIAEQQYQIERLKAEQRAANQPKVIYVQAPYPTKQPQQYAPQTQHIQVIQPSAPLNAHTADGYNMNATAPSAPVHPAYNPQTQPLVAPQPQIIQQVPPPPIIPHQHIQTVQATQAGQLTTEQHTYVQPQAQTKIVYVQKPAVERQYKSPETETLIEKPPQQTEEPPPESSGCCCTVM